VGQHRHGNDFHMLNGNLGTPLNRGQGLGGVE
jgi:hypothetical protein